MVPRKPVSPAAMVVEGLTDGAYSGIRLRKLLVNMVSPTERKSEPEKVKVNMSIPVAMGICARGTAFCTAIMGYHVLCQSTSCGNFFFGTLSLR